MAPEWCPKNIKKWWSRPAVHLALGKPKAAPILWDGVKLEPHCPFLSEAMAQVFHGVQLEIPNSYSCGTGATQQPLQKIRTLKGNIPSMEFQPQELQCYAPDEW
jgi:hypothetical protein